MRILINSLTAMRRRTGIGHYVGQLLRCFREQTPDVEVVTFPGRVVRRLFAETKRRASRQSGARLWLNRVSRTLASWHFQLFARRQSFDIYHEPNFIPFDCDRPTVATLLDLSVVLHPEWHPADRVRHFERNLHSALARCAHFIAISDSCRRELSQHLGIPPHKITRTYMGVRPGFRPLSELEVRPVLQRLHLPSKYLLHVGTLEPRKNVLLLMKAYCALPAALRSRCPLLLVGGWGWKTKKLVDFYQNEARHRGVIHMGYLANDDLPALCNGARALVFPSLYEGFGLPPLEMMACGGAVLASTADAVRETAGASAHLIEPRDLDAWRSAMERIIQDNDWRDQLRQGVAEHAGNFTWEACAEQTLQIYQRVCAGQHVSRLAA